MLNEQKLFGKDVHIEPESFEKFLKKLFEWDGTLMHFWFKRHFKIAELKRIIVLGTLDLSGKPVRFLPHNLVIRGNLKIIDSTFLKILPNNLKIEDSLVADGSSLIELPDDIFVGKSISLKGCKNISELPKNLKLPNGDLFIDDSAIKSLPDNKSMKKAEPYEKFYVGNNISIKGSKLSKNKELVKKYKEIYGKKLKS